MPAIAGGMAKTATATTRATRAAAAPALGASQRRGTSNQKRTTTGKAAKSVDHRDEQKILPWSGSRCCWYRAQSMERSFRRDAPSPLPLSPAGERGRGEGRRGGVRGIVKAGGP